MHRFLNNVMKKTVSEDNKYTDNVVKPHLGGNPPLVLGKIYANWCGHCKILEPKWAVIEKEIPKRFQAGPKPLVYKVEESNMDDGEVGLATLKSHLNNPDANVELQDGYPTIFKIAKGSLSYYEGPREIGPIITWAMEGLRKKKSSKKTHRGHKKRHSRHTRRR
jgi:thiol-disulfide isomerase/thioredoxin